jgi:hypothetical protein
LSRRNGLAVMLAFEGAKRLGTDLKERTVDIVESEEADEGAEGHTIRRKWPIVDKVKLGFSGTVAIGSDVMANVLDAVCKELAFLELESNTVFHKDVTDTLKQTKQGSKHGSPQQDVVDDDATALVSCIGRVARAEEGFPFALEDAHHAGVESGSVARPKRHDAPTVFLIVGSKEGKFLLVTVSDHNLMVAGFVVEGDKEEAASRVAEVVNGIVATWNRILEGQGDLIQAAIRDAQAPDEVFNGQDMFLVGLSSEDDGGAPGAKASADPAISLQDFDVRHDDLAFVGPIMGLLAADRRRGTGIDGKFEIQDRKLDTGAVEAIPMGFNDVDDGLAGFRSNVEADNKILVELR